MTTGGKFCERQHDVRALDMLLQDPGVWLGSMHS